MDNEKKSLFLDTATQIARHWHSKETQDEINGQLYGRKLYCSRYVKCQYKATQLNSIIYLHNLLVRSENLMEALQKATEGRFSREAGGRLTPGVLSRIVDIAYWISRWYKTYEEQVDGLRDLIEDAWETFFHNRIELPLVDETGCVYAEGHPKMGVSETYEPITISCSKKKPPECRVKKFWENHKEGLNTLGEIDSSAISTQSKDKGFLEKVKEFAGGIREGKPPCGQTCTVHLSDVIVCLESAHCPESVNVHSINRKHFGPLGEILGIQCEPSSE